MRKKYSQTLLPFSSQVLSRPMAIAFLGIMVRGVSRERIGSCTASSIGLKSAKLLPSSHFAELWGSGAWPLRHLCGAFGGFLSWPGDWLACEVINNTLSPVRCLLIPTVNE